MTLTQSSLALTISVGMKKKIVMAATYKMPIIVIRYGITDSIRSNWKKFVK